MRGNQNLWVLICLVLKAPLHQNLSFTPAPLVSPRSGGITFLKGVICIALMPPQDVLGKGSAQLERLLPLEIL